MEGIIVRSARVDDLEDISQIHKHYVENTVATFVEEPLPLDSFNATYHQIVSEGLPYLVAVDETTQKILGYANAHGFRGAKGAYRHTVEISLFCHPEHTGRGLGQHLITILINVMRAPEKYPDLLPKETSQGQGKVKQVLAVMAVDSTGRRNGLALRDFYIRNGFVLSGHLREVGYKFDRWIDTMYLQLSL